MRTMMISLAILLTAFLTPVAWAEPVPHLVLSSLKHQPFVLPDDVRGVVSVLFVGFSQKAGSNAKGWTDRVEKDFPSTPGLRSYTVAVLAGVPTLFRSMVVGFIENGTPANRRGTFLVTFSDETAWKTLAGFQAPDDPYVLVLGPDSAIALKVHGLFDESLYQMITERVRGLLLK